MEKRGQAARLDSLGKRILNASRNELTLSMRFLAAPLNALDYVMDLTTTAVGTDAVSIRFNPAFLFRLYTEEPARLNRTYLHMLLHCLFGHLFAASRFADSDLFDLAADIAVENVMDGMDADGIRRVTSDYRDTVYETLKKEIRVLTAEKIYAYFSEQDTRDPDAEERMAREFHADDHTFWYRKREDDPEDDPGKEDGMRPPLPLTGEMRQVKEQWDKEAKRVKSELDLLSKEASDRTGSLSWTLSLQHDTRTDYRKWLSRFSVVREEARPDPDTFDAGLYYYGLQRYGNLPLIEELEIREAKKIDELVIAIDTSASCAREQVQKFLNETAMLLKRQESFFHRVDVRIFECDDRLQHEIALSDVSEMEAYASRFTVKGGYGTDFRPVFQRVRELTGKGELTRLRALLYFTDGYGIYPDHAPPYEVAFLFDRSADYNTHDVPAWAQKLFF